MRMKSMFSLLTAAVVLAACSSQKPATSMPNTSAPKSANEGVPVIMGHTYTLFSEVLGMDRRLTVRLPYGYDKAKDKSYPVVYVIDGGPEQDFPHIAGIAQSGDINWTFTPFILVGIETINRRHQIVPPAADVKTYEKELGQKPGGSAKFREFIRKDVMAWVEGRYRTNGRKAVMGESLAGLFVIETLFEEPNLFDDYISVSPSMWWEDMKYGVEAKAYLNNLPSAPRRLYITSANEGYRHQEGIDKLVAALRVDAPDGLKWLYFARGDFESHASIYHVAALDAFRKFFPTTVRYGHPGPLLSGKSMPRRTAKQIALFAKKCNDVDTALQTTPQENQGEIQNENIYKCLVYTYGMQSTSGNMDVLSAAGELNQ